MSVASGGPAPADQRYGHDVADLVAAAACGVQGVVGLHPGSFGEAATYLPGRRVEGVLIGPRSCSVHVVLRWAPRLLPVVDAIRQAVRRVVELPVDITVEELVGEPMRSDGPLRDHSKAPSHRTAAT